MNTVQLEASDFIAYVQGENAFLQSTQRTTLMNIVKLPLNS
jgi:hypothetical protein